jgi:hypothetical protein
LFVCINCTVHVIQTNNNSTSTSTGQRRVANSQTVATKKHGDEGSRWRGWMVTRVDGDVVTSGARDHVSSPRCVFFNSSFIPTDIFYRYLNSTRTHHHTHHTAMHQWHHNDDDVTQTPPSLQTRVGGPLLPHNNTHNNTHTTPPSLQTWDGGVFLIIPHTLAHPRYKRETVGAISTCHLPHGPPRSLQTWVVGVFSYYLATMTQTMQIASSGSLNC